MKKTAENSHAFKRSYLRHLVPATVWLATVAIVVWLFYQRSQQFEIVGIARGEVRQIAASSTARITNIAARLFEPVKAGQTLAVVDTVLDNDQALEAELETRLATTAAEIERLIALMIPTQEQLLADVANRQINREDNYRRFVVDAETHRFRILELQAEITSARSNLDYLAWQVNVSRNLLEEDAIVPSELKLLQTQYDSAATEIEQNEQLLKQTEAALQQAEQRRDEFAKRELPNQSGDAAIEPIRRQIKVQGELMKGLLEQRAALRSRHAVELKSPIDGVIIPIHAQNNDVLHQRPGEQVVRRTGEVVAASDPILAVSQQEPTEIVAYVSEQQLGLLEKQAAVEVIKTRTPAQIARSEILCIGPTIELIPQRLWRNPNVPQWGRPVLINIPPGLSLVSGEVVGIRGR
jgi:multidrug resistance efflux pump